MATIGNRNQRVRIEQQVQTSDGQGGTTVSYALRCVVDALIEPLTGREVLAAAQVSAVLSTAVTIVFRSDISVKDRIRVRDRVLEVESYQDPTGRRDELRLLCSEVQS